MHENKYLRIAVMIAASILGCYNYYLGALLFLASAFITSANVNCIEYILLFVPVFFKAQSIDVLASGDLHSYVSIYNTYASGGVHENFSAHEFALLFIFDLFSSITGEITKSQLAFGFTLSVFLLFYPICIKIKNSTLIICLLAALDVNLIIHLFRQSCSILIFMNGFVLYERNKPLAFILFVTSYFMHITSSYLIFSFFLLDRLSFKLLKSGLVLSFVFGLFLFSKFSNFLFDFLRSNGSNPLIAKAAYGLNFVNDANAVSGFRLIAVSAGVVIFFTPIINQTYLNAKILKICILNLSVSFLMFNFPIVSTRVGLISTSLFTGFILGFFVLECVSFVKKRQT